MRRVVSQHWLSLALWLWTCRLPLSACGLKGRRRLEIGTEAFPQERVEPADGVGVLGPLGEILEFLWVSLVVVELPAGRAAVPEGVPPVAAAYARPAAAALEAANLREGRPIGERFGGRGVARQERREAPPLEAGRSGHAAEPAERWGQVDELDRVAVGHP